MERAFLRVLAEAMAARGFREVSKVSSTTPNLELLLKRQTWNTNRAVVAVVLADVPSDVTAYLRGLRTRVAFRCGFFPLLWGIGIQVIVVAPGFAQSGMDPDRYVARVDNQWAIIQGLFLVDPLAQLFRSSRSWGQFATGEVHDAISDVLRHYFQPQES